MYVFTVRINIYNIINEYIFNELIHVIEFKKKVGFYEASYTHIANILLVVWKLIYLFFFSAFFCRMN